MMYLRHQCQESRFHLACVFKTVQGKITKSSVQSSHCSAGGFWLDWRRPSRPHNKDFRKNREIIDKMADISDVETALCGLVEQAIYPGGLATPSVSGTVVKIYRGWPINRSLNADLTSGYQTVTVFSRENTTRDTSRYPRVWQTVNQTSPTLTVDIIGATANFGGTGGIGQTAGLTVNGMAYSVTLTAADTPVSVAVSFANLVPNAIAAGSSVTIPDARLTGLVVGSGTAIMETRRQEQGIMIAIWCPTPVGRDLLAASIDNALANTDWFTLTDGTAARLRYRATFETDVSENANLYRRDLDYLVEYPTTMTMTGAQMLFGVGTLAGTGPEVAFGCVVPPAKLVVPPLGAVRFDAWYDPSNTIDQQCAATLTPVIYQNRLPPNATLTNGAASWPLALQATMDAEIAAALQAGLAFWAFDSFQPDDTLSLALQLYLSSSLRIRLSFCMLGQTSNWGDGGQDQPSLLRDISMMTQPGYMTVLDNRPLYLVLDSSTAQTSGLPAGGVPAAIAFVRQQVQAAGGGNPYVIWLSGAALADYSNVTAAQFAGADASGAYAVPRLNGSEQPYAALTAAARTDWAARAATGFPMIPTAMSGWDQRPLIQTPQPFYPISSSLSLDNYYDTATSAEVGAHVVEMVSYLVNNVTACPAQVGLIYAWNELAEGGWLMPTYSPNGPDAERVAAIGAALAAAIQQSSIPTIDLIN